jgi:hypothetical protein
VIVGAWTVQAGGSQHVPPMQREHRQHDYHSMSRKGSKGIRVREKEERGRRFRGIPVTFLEP